MKLSLDDDPATFNAVLRSISDSELTEYLSGIIRQLVQVKSSQQAFDIQRVQNTRAFIHRISAAEGLPAEAIEQAKLALNHIETAYVLLRRDNH